MTKPMITSVARGERLTAGSTREGAEMREATVNPPRSVVRAVGALLVIAAIHVLALVLLATHRDVIMGGVASAHPDWSGAKIDKEATSRFLQSLIPHIIIPLVLVLRGRRLLRGRRRTRLIITVILGIQVAAHATLPLQLHYLPGYAAWLITVQGVSLVFELAALWLLWAPHETRAFFAPNCRAAAPTPCY